MSESETLHGQLDRLQRAALVTGVVGLVACGAGAMISPAQFFRSYLTGFLLWAGISLGCFALLMLHHIFGAGWGFVIQRILEAGTRTFPLVAALFLPIMFDVLRSHHLYEWTHAEAAADPLLSHKAAYLNAPFFIGRTVFYFLVWISAAHLLNKWSRQMDESGDPQLAERLRNVSTPGLLVYGLTATFATVDWAMSLDPRWFSTMFGLLSIAGQVLTTLAFCALVMRLLTAHEPLASVARPAHFHDLGNLMLAFTMIWAYLSFSQFLIIWSGNQPETIPWYVERTTHGWQWVGLGLLAFSFAVPFALLLSRQTKRRIETLAVVAGLVILMRLVDLFWVVAPNFHREGVSVHWLDVAAPAGIGGIWLWFFFRELRSRSLLPERDPRFVAAFAHAEHHG